MAASPPTASVRENAVGIVLIVAAVLVGILLLVKGYDSEGGVVSTGAESASPTTATTAPQAPTTSTTAPVTTNPPAQVSVTVANASGGSGLASKTQSTLQSKGYTQVAITNAPSVVTSTQILYVEGAKGDAEQVAIALGVDTAAVQPMPTPPPLTLSGATVLVLAGPDLA
jgi:hypothetical protein